jgi:2-dehydropantoate 2-reductase
MYMPLMVRKVIVSQLFKSDEAVSSTLQSVLRGKGTEIDYLNGEITRLASKNGLKAPVNEALVKAVKDVERSGLNGKTEFYTKDELKALVDEYKGMER